MEPGRGSFRRRKAIARTDGRHTRAGRRAVEGRRLLQKWRVMLAELEREAAGHGYGEVELLAGIAALAIDDLLRVTPPNEPGLRP